MVDVADDYDWIFESTYFNFLQLKYNKRFKMAVTDSHLMSISRELLQQLIDIKCLERVTGNAYNRTCGQVNGKSK
ncbi:unnamed protein product [Bursaphelenchus okinawaensis]|uniref:Uncharacterized protein n=1 Tax=Bursaphelenchus okinawaensis TaxID=465554 RepID=A0A811KCH8_9BILA|nr:unnamed protein product [Bursaphelenchus okinawaensis]CAG9099009.1 unnamed protein product [Bursaphelenchus okinawaensis]